MRALIFPGQGAQFIGMGKDLADSSREAMDVFCAVDEALGEKLSELIWEGDIEQLTLTKNTQPALMATSMAVLAALNANGFDIKTVSYVLGHSLGEYSALAAVGCLSLEDTARLLRVRGTAMQEATAVGFGTMAAILGLGYEKVSDIVLEVSKKGLCEIANDNDPAQVVVSGERNTVDEVIKKTIQAGARRAILLPVSAPFHCQLMKPAAEKMKSALDNIKIHKPQVPLVSNITAKPTNDSNEVRKLLIEQVTGTVQWRKSILFLAEQNVNEAWEIGAGKALSGMVRRIDKSIKTKGIISAQDVVQAAENFSYHKEV